MSLTSEAQHRPMKIGVVAPASRLDAGHWRTRGARARAKHLSRPRSSSFPSAMLPVQRAFRGRRRRARARAFLDVANDPRFRRGVVRARRLWLGPHRRARAWRGSRPRRARRPISATAICGFLLAGALSRRASRVAHGPMPADIRREGGEAAVTRGAALAGRARAGRAGAASPQTDRRRRPSTSPC